MYLYLKKNEATEIVIPAIDTADHDVFKSGLSPVDTAYYKDGTGAWTSLAIADTFAEIGSTGVYEISLTSDEMNHDYIVIKVSASGMSDTAIVIKTYTSDIDDIYSDAEAILVDTNELQTAWHDSRFKGAQ